MSENPLKRISTYVSGLLGSILTGGAIVGLPNIPVPAHSHPEYEVVAESQSEPLNIQQYADQVIAHINEKALIPCR